MSSGNTCSVINCTNSGVKIQIWKKKECEIHKPLQHQECPCLLPYSLHRFPGRSEDREVRQTWVKNINRKDFVPNDNSRVCGIHFLDGRPTKAHPYPVLHMGYEHNGIVSSARAPPKRRCLQPLTVNTSKVNCCATEPADIEVDLNNQENMPPQKCDVGVQWPDHTDHDYSSKKSTKDSATQTDPAPSVSAYDLDDKDCRFFTGIGIASFWQLLCAVTAFQPQIKSFKLAVHEQLLLV
ncbi:uncharacterized protein LOC121653081 [Melanotaenia boesemani]|nr:uncharacterized protein LOC121653081 [Melanotaenia boesemani]